RSSSEPKARQNHVAEHDTVDRPPPAGVATSRQDLPFQISDRLLAGSPARKVVPTAMHHVGRTHDTPSNQAGIGALAAGAACAWPARPTPAPSTARQALAATT